MTPLLVTRVALFLLIQGICYMCGYSRSTRLSQIDRLTDSHAKRLPLHGRKRGSPIEPFVFNSSANLSFSELNQEKDFPLNYEQTDRSWDESKLTEVPVHHHRTTLESKDTGSLMPSQIEQTVYRNESLALLRVLQNSSASGHQSESETPDITLPFDDKRILSAVLTDLRHVLQWTLNLSDIILNNLTGDETKSNESNVQTTSVPVQPEKTDNDINLTAAQVFIDLLPKVSKAFKSVIETAEDDKVNETNATSVTLDTLRRSSWKKKREYDASSRRHKRLVNPHPWKDSFHKRRSKDIYQQLPKECDQRAVAAADEYGVYHIQKGLMTSKLDPRDLENPLEFPIEGLENVPRYKNVDVALEFSFRHPLLLSGIGFKRLPSDRRDIVQLASIYVEKQRDRNSWSPLLDEETNKIMLFKVTSKTLHNLSPLHDAWSGIRLYPQKWSSSKPFIGRPIFIYCAFNP